MSKLILVLRRSICSVLMVAVMAVMLLGQTTGTRACVFKELISSDATGQRRSNLKDCSGMFWSHLHSSY